MVSGILLICLIGLFCVNASVLYGLVTTSSGDGTEKALQIVEVNVTSGATYPVTAAMYYYGESAISVGLSAFDQQNLRFLFATDYKDSYIYSVDVNRSLELAPVSIGSSEIHSLRYDTVGAQLLVEAIYEEDNSDVILSVPYDTSDPITILLNLTESGISTVLSTAIDQVKGVFFFVHIKGGQFYLSSFPLASPKTVASSPFACQLNPLKAWPSHLFYDFNANKILGIISNSTADQYFEIVGGSCATKPIGVDGAVYSATYDFTSSLLYLSYYTPKGPALVLFSSDNYTYTQFKVDNILTDIQVAYYNF